jgi:hypothetical protein
MEPLISERSILSGVIPLAVNITLTDANTEYSFEIPSGTRKFGIKTRNAQHTVKFSFSPGTSNTEYITLDGLTWNEDMVLARAVTVYCQSPTAGCVLECIFWR